MHDLNDIRRFNAERHADSIAQAHARGEHVVAYFTGLHLVSTTSHPTADAALVAVAVPCMPGDRRAYFPPTPAQRSANLTVEQLAALGRRSVGDPEPGGLAA